MNEAIQLEIPAQGNTLENNHNSDKPLHQCVADVMTSYFEKLEGHPTDDLYKMVMAEVEEPLFRSVMEYTRGNQSKASELLGINRGTLRKKLKQYGLHE